MLTGLTTGKGEISAILSEAEKEIIKEYIKGGVHSFCKNNPNDVFSVAILFGGNNKDWNGTALQILYDKNLNSGNSCDPYNQAACDAGCLLREVLEEDKRREFEYAGKATGHQYKFVGLMN